MNGFFMAFLSRPAAARLEFIRPRGAKYPRRKTGDASCMPGAPLSNDGITTMTILLLLLGVAFFGAMAGYVIFCERV